MVAVATGDGIARIFRSLGVHHFVPGGQSMNPSTAQILEVVESVPSPEVVLLPNNENIQPVAMQVVELAIEAGEGRTDERDRRGVRGPSRVRPGERSAMTTRRAMAESARRVVAGEVTRSVRDAAGPFGPIAKDDWMGLSREGIEVGRERPWTTRASSCSTSSSSRATSS